MRAGTKHRLWSGLFALLFVAEIGGSAQAEETGPAPAAKDAPRAFAPPDLEFFESKVRPLLVSKCHRCHGPKMQQGNLRLDARAFALTGGDTGPAIAPGKPDESLLIDAVRYGETYQMPPKGQLPPEDIATLEKWVSLGAPWPAEQPAISNIKVFDLQARRAAHWAFTPIAVPGAPNVLDKTWPRNSIDQFVLAALEKAGLRPASDADKRVLLRRATFDLTGLPPTPDEASAFLADESPEAFTKVVDRLLASPRFGERWARHWFDVVRYAETLGHEFDYPLTAPWMYRDYVIRAFNADLPYDQFVREHLAGDLLPDPRRHPTDGYNESILATTFWFLGEAVHAPVDVTADQATRIDNQIDTTTKAFLGLTVGCARCHDHKFDAISTKDYYALAGYLRSSRQQDALLDPHEKIAGVNQALAEAADAASDVLRNGISASIADNTTATEVGFNAIVAKISKNDGKLPPSLQAWRALELAAAANASDFAQAKIGLLARRDEQAKQRAARVEHETAFADFTADNFSLWTTSGWAFGLRPTRGGQLVCDDDNWRLAESGWAHSGALSSRLQGTLCSPTFTIERPFIVYRLAGHSAKLRLIVDGFVMDTFNALLFEGMAMNVDTGGETRILVQDASRYLGHRAHIEFLDYGDGYLAVDEIRFSDTRPGDEPSDLIESGAWSADNVDSLNALRNAYRACWRQAVEALRLNLALTAEQLDLLRIAQAADALPLAPQAKNDLSELAKKSKAQAAALPQPVHVTAIADGTADDSAVYVRGSHKNLGDIVPRRFIEALGGVAAPNTAVGSGRRELAERLLSDGDPLPARVMANRVWRHLLGSGIVETVDNFGVLGERPTHPELLDHLASRFRGEGWSIKRLIRQIMLSRTYQMASSHTGSTAAAGEPNADLQDPRNLLLHRANVRRLEGEAIRDAILSISGRLDTTMYGPPVPVNLTDFMQGRGRPGGSGPLDGAGRRSVYQEVRRNFIPPFMLAYDTPAPFSAFGRRNVSNVPAQSLILMNDPFVVEQAKRWAERELATGTTSADEHIAHLYRAAFAREATADERSAAINFLQAQSKLHGASPDDLRVWSDLCHVLFNVKEFILIR